MRLRRLAPWILGSALCCSGFGCSSSREPSDVDAGDASDDHVEGPPCLTCTRDAAPEDASLTARIYGRLLSCEGIEGCHVSGAGGLAFPPDDVTANLVDVPSTERPDMVRVKPGDPSQSYLYLKLLGDGGIEGERMPLGGPYDPAVIALFSDWIEAGAPKP